jgi:ABC-type dipeptide/oligopeptide/nickel transport system ATPase subunit
MKKLVEITNLSYSVRPNSLLRLGNEKEILKNISLEVRTNEIIGITGESGSGKTTLIKLIAGILKPTTGEIKFTSQQDWQKIKTNPVQILFQNNNEILNPFRRIEDIIEEAIRIRNKSKTDIASEKERIFNSVGFTIELRNRKGYELSGGEQQRAALSRILAAKPELLILDEPFSAQDVESQVNLLQLFKKINEEFNLTMICVAHNLKILRKLADKIFVMYNGEIVESGNTEDIFNSPQNDYTKFLIKCENYDLKTPKFKFTETLAD